MFLFVFIISFAIYHKYHDNKFNLYQFIGQHNHAGVKGQLSKDDTRDDESTENEDDDTVNTFINIFRNCTDIFFSLMIFYCQTIYL